MVILRFPERPRKSNPIKQDQIAYFYLICCKLHAVRAETAGPASAMMDEFVVLFLLVFFLRLGTALESTREGPKTEGESH